MRLYNRAGLLQVVRFFTYDYRVHRTCRYTWTARGRDVSVQAFEACGSGTNYWPVAGCVSAADVVRGTVSHNHLVNEDQHYSARVSASHSRRPMNICHPTRRRR